jgi:hypothetical protein
VSVSPVTLQSGPSASDLELSGVRLEEELGLLTHEVLEVCGGRLSSLMAVGSIGRAHVAGLQPSQLRPDDYDLIAVLNGGTIRTVELQRRIDRRLTTLGDRVGAPISLGVLRVRDLPHLPFTLFNYEMRYAGRVLWGEDPSNDLPDYEAGGMPIIEATRLLLNRGVLLWGDVLRVRQSVPRGIEAEAVLLRNRKAIMGIGDALLIAAGSFHWSYPRRLEEAARCKLFNGFQSLDLRERYIRVTNAKLKGESPRLDEEELALETLEIFALHDQVMRYIEELRLGREIGDWRVYASSDLKYPAHLRASRSKRLARLLLRFGPPRGNRFYRRHWGQAVEEVLMMAFPRLAYGLPTRDVLRGALNWRPDAEADSLTVWRRFRRLWREAR